MSATTWTGAESVLEYKYDFDNDAGAIGTIALGNLPTGFVATEMFVVIDTTITSGGTPTIILGEDGGGDADGYFADFFGTPTAGTALKGGGALLSDGVHIVAAAKDGILMTIGTAALTAGAFRIFVKGIQS